jgi:hypothetical protein
MFEDSASSEEDMNTELTAESPLLYDSPAKPFARKLQTKENRRKQKLRERVVSPLIEDPIYENTRAPFLKPSLYGTKMGTRYYSYSQDQFENSFCKGGLRPRSIIL